MIYLDNGATSYPKPASVIRAVQKAMAAGGSSGRGGYGAAMGAARALYDCRIAAGELFHTRPEQVVFTMNGTHGLNIAIRSLFRPGSRVVVSGFEHNAVMRPLYALGANITVAGRKLFDPDDTLAAMEQALRRGADGLVVAHVSNVFGYILPVEQIGGLCRKYGTPWILDAAQSAGKLSVDMEALGADFIAMPGHKGLLGPQGTGLLLCKENAQPLLFGGTGNDSISHTMPEALPERLEAGTQNTPGIAGLAAGIRCVQTIGTANLLRREQNLAKQCAAELETLGFRVFSGKHQAGTLSFLGEEDSEELAATLANRGIALRAGLHCAPLAHESAGTLETGTLRLSFGHQNTREDVHGLIAALRERYPKSCR